MNYKNYASISFYSVILFVIFGSALRVHSVVDCQTLIIGHAVSFEECHSILNNYIIFDIVMLIVFSILGIYSAIRYFSKRDQLIKVSFTKQAINNEAPNTSSDGKPNSTTVNDNK